MMYPDLIGKLKALVETLQNPKHDPKTGGLIYNAAQLKAWCDPIETAVAIFEKMPPTKKLEQLEKSAKILEAKEEEKKAVEEAKSKKNVRKAAVTTESE